MRDLTGPPCCCWKKSVFHQGQNIYFGGLDAICNKLTVCLVEMKQIYFSLSVRNSALYPIYIASNEYVWGINQSKTSIIYHCGIYLTFGSDQRTLTTNGVTWIHNLFRYDCRSCFSIKIFKELIHETRSIIIYQQNKHSSTGVTWYTTNELKSNISMQIKNLLFVIFLIFITYCVCHSFIVKKACILSTHKEVMHHLYKWLACEPKYYHIVF